MEYCKNVAYDCFTWCDSYINWFDALIYIAVFIALYFAITLEYYDLYCPKDCQKCQVGNAAAIIGGKPSKYDDVDTLLKKIRISSRYDEASVYWRRSIVFSTLLLFTLLLFILRRLPTGVEILTSFVIIYLFIYLFLVYYQEALSKPATKQVDEATELLSE